jgi:hypothetical protein
MINKILLEKITNYINSDACNYTVFLKAYDIPCKESEPSQSLIEKAIGEGVVVVGFKEVDLILMLSIVEGSLMYKGEDVTECNRGEGKELILYIDELKRDITNLFNVSNIVESFWFRKGHPAYPVFWDFAYIFRCYNRALIFVGSSSD